MSLFCQGDVFHRLSIFLLFLVFKFCCAYNSLLITFVIVWERRIFPQNDCSRFRNANWDDPLIPSGFSCIRGFDARIWRLEGRAFGTAATRCRAGRYAQFEDLFHQQQGCSELRLLMARNRNRSWNFEQPWSVKSARLHNKKKQRQSLKKFTG